MISKKIKIETITKGEVEYTITKMPLGRYAEAIGALEKIPEHFDNFTTLDDEVLIAALPAMAKDSWVELISILSIASNIPYEDLDKEIGLKEAADIIKAIWEVNGFDDMGKALGRLGEQLMSHITSRAARLNKAPKNGAKKP